LASLEDASFLKYYFHSDFSDVLLYVKSASIAILVNPMDEALQPIGSISKFCGRCRHLLQTPQPRKSSTRPDILDYELKCAHHDTPASFVDAIQVGCPICSLVFNEYKVRHPTMADELWSWTKRDHSFPAPRNEPISTKCPIRSTWHRDIAAHISRDSLRIELFEGPKEQNGTEPERLLSVFWEIIPYEIGSIVQSFPSLNLTSTASIDINPWLQDCLNNHTCWKDGQHGYLPPRFIDCREETLRLMLCEEVERPHTYPYTALSHCWGTRQTHMILTTENLDELRKGMDFDSLPPTFKDAIKATRKLGIPYLWIDSLCIIQKGSLHLDDWHLHVREMASIYSNCILNIAASHATDSNGGCFSEPSVLATPILIPSPNIDRALLSKVTAREPDSLWMLDCTLVLPYPKPGLSVLNSRAWVYQERLLSPRIVHYEKNDVYWECYESYRSALFPDGSKHFPFRKPEFLQDVPLFDWRLSEDGPSGPLSGSGHYSPFFFWSGQSSLFHNWGAIVRFFSSCRLTRQTDRFPAIAAIAQRLSVEVNERYIAGFFESLLPRALLWGDYSEEDSSEEYIAPSWSWASVTGLITWAYQASSDLLCQIRKLDVRLVDEYNEYGQISWGSIELEGTEMPIQVWRIGESLRDGFIVKSFDAMGSQKLSALDVESVGVKGVITLIATWDNKDTPTELDLIFFPIAQSVSSTTGYFCP
jgi:Heterokaryon incompatibility protein (HET)